jgi:crotonobetainyl-CoA:carnitine CoA-transferase CaiB-like acyl-CoA transferase
MVHQPMAGVKMVEVAQFTFTPAAGAVLAEWGADVIKIEHAVTGDAQRGLRLGAVGAAEGSYHPIMEHPNRGKRSIGLSLDTPGGYEVLMDLCKDADIFLINFLPDARRRLKLDVEDIRKANPNIIYVRGSGHGQRGPEAEKGGYDQPSFWCRSGAAWSVTPPDMNRPIGMPGGAYGDSLGGMTIAGGILGALYARERTGEPSVVDVSLLGVGMWAMALTLANTMLTGNEFAPPPLSFDGGGMSLAVNPIVGNFRTSDGRWINFNMLQPGRYFADVCKHLEIEHLLDDERFQTAEGLMANAAEAGKVVAEAIAAKPFAFWLKHLQTMEGQWAPLQSPLELLEDPQVVANDYLLPIVDADGNERRLVANPVQFDERPPPGRRAPQFAEHTDDILRGIGRSEDEIIQLKIDGACT